MAAKDKPPARAAAPSPRPKPSPPSSPRVPRSAHEGERIAKVLSRRGIASRREAERLIALGEVSVNGRVIDSPALNVTGQDIITVSGKALPAEERARLWLYHKPAGLVTSAADEKGRETVFDHLPADLPRVMPVGRLDLTSEGLLLLTNDGALKRRLELPSTGWTRRYRVRVNGRPDDAMLQPLREGIVVEGERFRPMQVTLDRQQGANAWLTATLREGRNREVRRAMAAIGLQVNRLIRIGYGPFRLEDLPQGELREVPARILRDQLGLAAEGTPVSESGPVAEAKGRAKAKHPRAEDPAEGLAGKPAGKPPGRGAGTPGRAAAAPRGGTRSGRT